MSDSFYARLATSNSYAGDQYFGSGRPWFDVRAFGAKGDGTTDDTPAFSAAILASTGSAAPATSTRQAQGPVYIPAGTYKVSSDLLIQSVSGFQLIGAGADCTTLVASGAGFTTAIVNIDGSLDGRYGGFAVKGDGTEGTASTGSGGGIPCGVDLTWTTAAQRSTTGNTLFNIRVRNLLFTTGVSLAGVGTRQLDGTYMQDIVVAGLQVKGGWSTSARTDTGLCGTNSTTTVTDTAAATADLGLPISGPGIPANTTITLVTPTVGYTISHAATATASPVTFTVGTNFWQAGYAFGNGGAGNIYAQVATACGAGGCYYGYKVLESGFALTGAQPGGNAADFYIIPNAQTTITNVQSQASGQLVVGPGSGSAIPVSFRDIEFAGWTGSTAGSGTPNYNPAWISIGTSYGNWVFENLKYSGALVSGNPPVIDCGSSDYAACFTLINVSAPVEPAIGIVPGSFGSSPADTAAVICINWQNTAAGRVLTPFYAVNSNMLYQQGTAGARPPATGTGSFGELLYWATDTQVLSRSNGWTWTTLLSGIVTTIDGVTVSGTPATPFGQVLTATSATAADWELPAGSSVIDGVTVSGSIAVGNSIQVTSISPTLQAGWITPAAGVTLETSAAVFAADGIPYQGATGAAADAGHVHPGADQHASDAGYVAWTGDPFTGYLTRTASSIGIYQASGAICLTRLNIPSALTANGYLSFYWVQPTGGSPASSFVGLYNAAGTQLWTSSDLTSTATGLQRLNTSVTSYTAGPLYVASVIGTQGSTAGGLAMYIGGLTLATGATQLGSAPWRCSSKAGSATSLPGSLTYSTGFAKNYYYTWSALD